MHRQLFIEKANRNLSKPSSAATQCTYGVENSATKSVVSLYGSGKKLRHQRTEKNTAKKSAHKGLLGKREGDQQGFGKERK